MASSRDPMSTPRDSGGWTRLEFSLMLGTVALAFVCALPPLRALERGLDAGDASTQLLNDVRYAQLLSQRNGVRHYVQTTQTHPIRYQVRRALDSTNLSLADPIIRTTDFAMHNPDLMLSARAALPGFDSASPTIIFDELGLPETAASMLLTYPHETKGYALDVSRGGTTSLTRRSEDVQSVASAPESSFGAARIASHASLSD